MSKRRIWFLFTFVFIAGLLAGAAAMHAYFQAHTLDFIRSSKGHYHEFYLERLQHDLRLTDAQHAQINEIVTATHSQLQKLRQRTQPEAEAIIAESNRKISGQLTPDQAILFQEMLKRMPPVGSAK